MPNSIRENDDDVVAFVKDKEIKHILDVGVGRGTYGLLLSEHADILDGVEVWKPYIEQFGLRDIYQRVYEQDIRSFLPEDFAYDLVIFGDILEHMSREDSMRVWERASTAKYGLISVPIVHWPQGAEYGNPYEVHVQEHLTPESIKKDYGPFVFEREYKVTGTYIKEF